MNPSPCPSCKTGRLFYIMRSIERHSMDGLPDASGYVDLISLEDSHADDLYVPWLECQKCMGHFNLDLSVKKEK